MRNGHEFQSSKIPEGLGHFSRGERLPRSGGVVLAVVGGGPAGVCAAVSTARLGAKVVLVERFGCLGGNLTLGHVSPILGKVSKGTMADEIRTLLNARHQDAPKVMTRNGPEEHIDHEEATCRVRMHLKADREPDLAELPDGWPWSRSSV